MLRKFAAALLTGAAVIAMSHAAIAAAPNSGPSAEGHLRALEAELDNVRGQLVDLKRSQSNQYDDLNQRAGVILIKLDNGRPTITTGDGNFSVAFRTLVQF